MSLNIAESVLRVSSEITQTIDINKLGKLQRNRLVSYLRTGFITSGGVPADIAKHLLTDMGGSMIRMYWRKSHVQWKDINQPEVLDKFKAYGVLMKLQSKNVGYRWYNDDATTVASGQPSGNAYVVRINENLPDFVEFMTGTKLQQPQPVNTLADGIESGKVTKLALTIYKGN